MHLDVTKTIAPVLPSDFLPGPPVKLLPRRLKWDRKKKERRRKNGRDKTEGKTPRKISMQGVPFAEWLTPTDTQLWIPDQ